MENDYIPRVAAFDAIFSQFCASSDETETALNNAIEEIKSIPAADVLPRDEAIKMGAELAAMHGSDATSQQLEEAYLKGVEYGMTRRDVRPVVRGKWIPDYDYTEYDYDGSTLLPEPLKFQDGWQCSLCGEYTPSKTNYCTNCGAAMREKSR